MRSCRTYLLLLVLALPLMGCATQSMDANGYTTRRYLGWLELTEYRPASRNAKNAAVDGANSIDEAAQIERVRAFGIRMEQGLAMGYFDDSLITLPRECRLIIVVKNPDQIDQIAKTTPAAAGDVALLVDFLRSAPANRGIVR